MDKENPYDPRHDPDSYSEWSMAQAIKRVVEKKRQSNNPHQSQINQELQAQAHKLGPQMVQSLNQVMPEKYPQLDKKRGLRFNLLWYIPLTIWVFFYFVLPNIISGYHNILTVWTHLTWGLFISPSAYVFYTATLASVMVPLCLLSVVPFFFVKGEEGIYNKRYLFSFCVIIGIIVVEFVTPIIIWGSFPLGVDKSGYEHLRMIPFFPWPNDSLFR